MRNTICFQSCSGMQERPCSLSEKFERQFSNKLKVSYINIVIGNIMGTVTTKKDTMQANPSPQVQNMKAKDSCQAI